MDYVDHYKKLQLRRDGAVMRITINNPERRNALDPDTQVELGRVYQDIADDMAVRCVVITGSGKLFSAGGDVPKMQIKVDDPGLFYQVIPNSKRIVSSILDCPKPIVCRLNGAAMGLAATIALLSDVVIAEEDAKIGDPHTRVGLVAGDGGAVIWPQLIGFARAKRYLLTGDAITGREAAEIGLITAAVPPDQLDAEVEKWVQHFSTAASNSISGTKMAINSALKSLVATAIDVGMAYEGLSNISRDHQEAITAFIEKRKPEFTGD